MLGIPIEQSLISLNKRMSHKVRFVLAFVLTTTTSTNCRFIRDESSVKVGRKYHNLHNMSIKKSDPQYRDILTKQIETVRE
jgi:hypothetical protein